MCLGTGVDDIIHAVSGMQKYLALMDESPEIL